MGKLSKTICLMGLLSILNPSTGLFAAGRSDRLKPKWLTESVPESISHSYMFVSSHGQGLSVEAAKQSAFAAMAQKLEIERGLTVNTKIQISEKLTQKSSSVSSGEYSQEIVLDVTENGHELQIVCREIDEYWTASKGVVDIDVLYTVTNTNAYGGSYDDDILVTSDYGLAAGFMSVVPSLGQFHKGDIVKGSLIIGTEIASIGGVIICENTRASYIKKMQEQPKYASQYNSLADTWETGRNVFIGVAAAVYVYNLIDAFTSTGAKKVVVKNKRFSVVPVHYPGVNGGAGIAFTYKF